MTTFSLASSFIFKHNKTNLFECLEKEKPSLTTWKRRSAYNFFQLCQSRLRQIRVKQKNYPSLHHSAFTNSFFWNKTMALLGAFGYFGLVLFPLSLQREVYI